MRTMLLQEDRFNEVVRVQHKLIKNVIKEPGETKFHRLKLSNDTIRKSVDCSEQSRFLFELLGFVKEMQPGPNGQMEEVYQLYPQNIQIEEFRMVDRIMERIAGNGSAALRPALPEAGKNNPVKVTSSKKDEVKRLATTNTELKSKLWEAQQERRNRQVNAPQMYREQQHIAAVNESADDYYSQMKQSRQSSDFYKKWNEKKKMITGDQIQQQIDGERRQQVQDMMLKDRSVNEKWGIRCLVMTNEFRAKHGLSALVWN